MISLGEIFGGFSGAKMRLLIGAGAVAGVGLLWNGGSNLTKADTIAPASKVQESLRANWSEGMPLKEEYLSKGDRWSGGAIRLGVSFIGAMILGSLLRVAVRTMATILLVGAALFWFLQSQGVVQPAWSDYYGSVSESRNWLFSQVGAIGSFLGQHLPSTGAALVGFGFGLRK